MSNGLKNVRVEYSIEATVNIGDFQNVKPGYRISADVEDGVHPNEAKDRLKALAESWLEAEVAEIKREASS